MLFTPQKTKKRQTNNKFNEFNKSDNYKSDNYNESNNNESNNPYVISESGLLLIQGLDPLSKLFSHITRQEYSLIGTYYIYSDTPDISIKILNIFNCRTPNWMKDYKYLHEIESGCNKIVMIPFIDPNYQLNIHIPNNSTKKLLIDIFGNNLLCVPIIKTILEQLYPNNNSADPNTSDPNPDPNPDHTNTSDPESSESVNNNSADPNTSDPNPDHTNPNTIPNNIDPILSMILESPVMNKNKKEIIIPTIRSKNHTVKKFKPDRVYLSKVIATFIDMILSDPYFLDLIIGNYFNIIYSYDLLYEIVINHIEIQEDTIELFRSLFSNEGLINKEQLRTLVYKINKSKTELLGIEQEITKQITKHKNLPDIPAQMTVIDKTPTPAIVQSVKKIKSQVEQIIVSIRNGSVPCIELNSIISSINDLSEYYELGSGIDLITQPSSGILIISPYSDISIPLTLKSGNKITLTTRNFNLSNFTKAELIEILETIETLVSDNRYDNLRAEITREITKKYI